MEPEFAPSTSSGIHLQHISSEQQGDIEMHQPQEEQQQQQQLTQGWQQHQHQPENHSNQQELFEESPMKQREESQPQLHEQSSPQPQQEQQHSQLEQQQQRRQVQQVQMQQPPQQQPQQHLQQGQMQPPPQQQQPQQSQQLQQHQQELPQSQQEQLQPQQQLSSQPQQQHLQQVPQSQSQQQLQQVQSQLQQQHLQQLLQSQQQLQQSQLQSQQQHLKQLPQAQQEQQPPPPQQQLQQSSMSSQQHLQQLPQSQHQPQQQLQQSPLPSQPQHMQQLPQSQQQPQQQMQQSSLPSPQQHLQQHQQQHLQQLPQRQQQLQVQVQQQQQQLSHQQAPQPATGQTSSSTRGQNASISFGSLIPIILPHISRDQSMQLQQLYAKLRKNEVTKEDFLRLTRKVVGDTMLVNAVKQMQQRQAQSQSVSSANPNQQPQQPQQQQKHTQGVSQQFSQPYQQVPPVNLQQQSHRTSDHQPHSHTSAPTSMPMSHSSSENNPQHSRQAGEQRSEFSSTHLNQTSALSLHQVKQEVDRTLVGFPSSSQQQQQHLQLPQSPFPMYARNPANYSSQSFSVSPGISQPSGVKVPVQDPQTRQVMHAQGGVQAQGGPPQLSNMKTMPKYDTSKLSKRREDEERQKMLQSGGTSHFSVQHQPSIWPTALDKEQAGHSGIAPASSVHIKQETNDNGDRPHAFQTLQPFADNHGQPAVLQKSEDQSVKTSTISSGSMPTGNQPLGSTVVHSDHVIQAPLATSSGTALHHPLSAFGGPISGGHSSGAALQGQMRGQVPSTPPSSALGSQIKTPPKKPMIGQKKPYEVAAPPSQVGSKKQKVSGGFLDQSIDQLNDVTAVSGVNLKEEEEQLFAGPKEESRATEAMRRVVQEEEERTFLKKGPLHAKLVGIMAKYGLKHFSTDSERCLSLCVEERLRTMTGQLIRLSKQRVDLEKASHKVDITSDVRRQILEMNKKAKEDLEKKQAEEAEKLRKLNEPENNPGPEGEKDEARTKAQKAHKEEDDKMRANAANVAARAAVGGDDMLSKWQLMAEQARQKREGTSDGASVSRNRDVNKKNMVGGSKSANISDHQDSPSTGMGRNLGRTLVPSSQPKPVRTICVKDVIALLERDPHMTKSTLLYRLYERDAESNKENASENQNNENT